MAKSGTSRHSKPVRKPVTIDLDPSQVKRVSEPEANAKQASDAKQVPPAEPVGDFSRKPKAAAAKPAAKPETADMKTEEIFAEKPKAQASTTASGRPAAAKAPAKPAGNGGGGFSHLAAGIAGGIIALAGAAALQWGNVLPSPGSGDSADRLTRIEQEVAQLRSVPAAAGLDEQSRAQLTQAQETARQALQQAQGTASDIASLKQTVEAQPAAGNGAATQELTDRIAALEEKITAVETRATQAADAASQDSGSLADIRSKLTALEAQVADQSRQPAVAAAIAATALKSAIDRGGSFTAELDSYASVAPQSPDIDALRKFAGTGVPTIADLNARFDPVANRIVGTERNVDPNAGFLDQLMASAKSLVKVRPVGEVSGDSVGAITARIGAALQAGDLDRAIAEWETLPENAKAVSTQFADEMKARRDTDALVSRTLAAALKPASSATPSAN